MFLSIIFVPLLVFQGALSEEEESDETFALKYLSDYHYLSLSRSGNQDAATAITKFQRFVGLSETGKLDEETMYQMKKPRCGVPDVDNNSKRMRVKRYWATTKWSKMNLKYYLSYGEDLSHSKQDRIFAKAFKIWSDVEPKLKFSRTYSVSDADLKISFGKGSHAGPGEKQCLVDFDGKGNVLAHAITPEDGRIHFDEDEKFSQTGRPFWTKSESLIHNAVHEIGHALGLGHSDVKDAVMWPFTKRGTPKLHRDDIDGIKALYG